MPPRTENPYAVLGVAPEADHAEIRRSYLALMRDQHPDRRAGDRKATAAAARINAAYAQLRDPARRAVVDRLRGSPEPVGATRLAADGAGRTRAPGGMAPGGVAPARPAYSPERADYGHRFQLASLKMGAVLLLLGFVLLLALGR